MQQKHIDESLWDKDCWENKLACRVCVKLWILQKSYSRGPWVGTEKIAWWVRVLAGQACGLEISRILILIKAGHGHACACDHACAKGRQRLKGWEGFALGEILFQRNRMRVRVGHTMSSSDLCVVDLQGWRAGLGSDTHEWISVSSMTTWSRCALKEAYGRCALVDG